MKRPSKLEFQRRHSKKKNRDSSLETSSSSSSTPAKVVLGGLFRNRLLRSTSAKSVATEKSTFSTTTSSTNSKSAHNRSIEQPSMERGRQRNVVTPENRTGTRSRSIEQRLRSKSPSRARLQLFMEDMKARERSKSRERLKQDIGSGSLDRSSHHEKYAALFQASDERIAEKKRRNSIDRSLQQQKPKEKEPRQERQQRQSSKGPNSAKERLRSKSPSRQRLNAFMADLRSRERSKSRERVKASIQKPPNRSLPRQVSDDRLEREKETNEVQQVQEKQIRPSKQNLSEPESRVRERLKRQQQNKRKSMAQQKSNPNISRAERDNFRKCLSVPKLSTESTSATLNNLSYSSLEDKISKQKSSHRNRYSNADDSSCSSDSSSSSEESEGGISDMMPKAKTVDEIRLRSQAHLKRSSGDEMTSKPKPQLPREIMVVSDHKKAPAQTLFQRSGSSTGRLSKTNDRGLGQNESPADGSNEWHIAILNHDWLAIENLLEKYDHTVFQGKQKSSPSKRLRMLKYFPSKQIEKAKQETLSPLLQIDSKGRTPLHLACKEHMPQKLLMRLFFKEKSAVSELDSDGRYPLHISIISNLNKHVIDRMIRGHPGALGAADNLGKTPMAYAILRATHQQNASESSMTWRFPTTTKDAEWQNEQEERWSNTMFLLETMVTRRKLLHKRHEKFLLVDSIRGLITPTALRLMLTVSAKILREHEGMAIEVFQYLTRYNYPLPVYSKALRIYTHSLPEASVIAIVRQAMIDCFESGSIGVYREDKAKEFSFRTEIRQMCVHQQKLRGNTSRIVFGEKSKACQEWWEKLKFLIGYSSYNFGESSTIQDMHALHAALTIPDAPPSLIELLIRIMPQSRYEADPLTGALPIHLASKYWIGSTSGKANEKMASKVLNLLFAGDSSFLTKSFKRRLPLHHAIASGKPLVFIKTLLSLDSTTAGTRDPLTRLYPFQLAATIPPRSNSRGNTTVSLDASSRSQSSRDDAKHLDSVFELLRANPVSIYPKSSLGSGDPKNGISPVTRHVLSYCYTHNKSESLTTKMTLNMSHVQLLREAINMGSIPSSLNQWWSQMKMLIWKLFEERNQGRKHTFMPQDDDYLLHAALCNGETPPIVIELILELYPDSVHKRIPGTDRYPLHIAAGSPSYHSLPFEKVISVGSALEMVILMHPDALHLESACRSGLHIAIDAGKTWRELKPIVDADPDLLCTRDICSGLHPFLQVATKETYEPVYRRIRNQTRMQRWSDQSSEENGMLLRDLIQGYENDKLTSIFEMLRTKPEALASCTKNIRLVASKKISKEKKNTMKKNGRKSFPKVVVDTTNCVPLGEPTRRRSTRRSHGPILACT